MNAQTNELLEGLVLQLDEDVLVEQTLTEAHQSLHAIMEDVGYELDADTLEEAFFAVAEFMESEEFDTLSEEEQKKVKDGFKMVFGKLRKIGKEVFSKKGMKQLGNMVRSGEAGDMARRALRKGADKALGAIDKKLGGRIEKGAQWLDKKTGGAIGRAYQKSKAKDAANQKKIRAYYKKALK
jgi:hypothetical protein